MRPWTFLITMLVAASAAPTSDDDCAKGREICDAALSYPECSPSYVETMKAYSPPSRPPAPWCLVIARDGLMDVTGVLKRAVFSSLLTRWRIAGRIRSELAGIFFFFFSGGRDVRGWFCGVMTNL
ncbi:hypothetical protein FN846DRAFT_929598 [Sphaerosporella brunnea]|uniref:Uncharacterized protein n=1 Tax=Sphaerosporella brunnea TaxID=1250544 RepID=A0A5J5F8G3_9PEZI|nr:hypothetical protein FN846DRAFT_929598 [Sphaerosporella brunnea]